MKGGGGGRVAPNQNSSSLSRLISVVCAKMKGSAAGRTGGGRNKRNTNELSLPLYSSTAAVAAVAAAAVYAFMYIYMYIYEGPRVWRSRARDVYTLGR